MIAHVIDGPLRRTFVTLLAAVVNVSLVVACATTPGSVPEVEHSRAVTTSPDLSTVAAPSVTQGVTGDPHTKSDDSGMAIAKPDRPVPMRHQLLNLTHSQRTGSLGSTDLVEVSGLVASANNPGVLFAIHDSGNSPNLYAISERGTLLDTWPVDAQNRDWEDMASIVINGKPYLIIGDTGNNLKVNIQSVLYLLEEPDIHPLPTAQSNAISPAYTITFNYSDGPRNVEAFGVSGNSVYLISKEPVTNSGPAPSALYQLDIPDTPGTIALTANRIGTLPMQARSLESRLVASLASVDLNHVTAMDFDDTANTVYLLTYRHVLKIERSDDQSWLQAFVRPARRIHTHNLGQAEALAVSPGRAIWFTSENFQAPLWAIPILAPVKNQFNN